MFLFIVSACAVLYPPDPLLAPNSTPVANTDDENTNNLLFINLRPFLIFL